MELKLEKIASGSSMYNYRSKTHYLGNCNKSAKQINIGSYAPTRRLNRKQLRTDCNVIPNGLINRAFIQDSDY